MVGTSSYSRYREGSTSVLLVVRSLSFSRNRRGPSSGLLVDCLTSRSRSRRRSTIILFEGGWAQALMSLKLHAPLTRRIQSHSSFKKLPKHRSVDPFWDWGCFRG